MKKFTSTKGVFFFLIALLALTKLSAQTATITPVNSTIAAGQSQNFTVVTTGFGNTNNNRTFVYTITGPGVTIPASPAVFNCTNGCDSESESFQFNTPGSYNVSVTVTQTQGGAAVASTSTSITVLAPNVWATSTSGTQISSFTVLNGTYYAGPVDIFAPSGGSTAALGRNTQPNPGAGHFYWLPNSGTNGQVDIWGATAAGGSQTLLADNFDVNGASTESLGFVRLAMDASGDGWILAGDGDNNLYLSRFDANQLAAVAPTVIDADVTISGGSVATFDNGDICISGNGNIYALANNGSGVTQIFIGQANGASTTLTKQWDLVDEDGDPFTGSVNGVAFDIFGSLYISTSTGLYYIDQATVNGPAGTVECSLVFAVTGLQDLASNVFPTQSTLPVKLISFSGSLNGNMTSLNWVTENLQNFDRFEIERSTNGSNYTSIGQKLPVGDPASRTTYQFGDNIASLSENIIYYRLRMIDADGSFAYSNVIFVRRDQKGLTGLVINPNPIIKGSMATARFEASLKGSVEFNVIDMNGKVVHKQQNVVTEGTNSVTINNLERLQAGMYILQMRNGENVLTTKFSIAR
jgi:hypothetical protein